MRHFRSASLVSAVVVAGLAVSSQRLHAATPLTALRYASDITVTLGGTTITPANVAEDDLAGVVTAIDVGSLPADSHVDAYQLLANGDQLLSFDTTVTLPGGVLAGPADVVRFTGAAYTIAFDGAANGVPEGVNVDAVAVSNGELLLSFDTSVRLSGTTFEDEDLVRFDSTGPAFAAFFTGADAGVPADLDLDGAQVLAPQRLLVSFDGSGTVGGTDFNDDDVLEYDGSGGTWELAYNGAAHHEGWGAADLVALYALVAVPSPTPTATSVAVASATLTPTVSATPSATSATPSATRTATATSSVGTVTPTSPAPGTATSTATMPTSPTATLTPVITGTPPTVTPTTPPAACVGDCDGSGEVTINELITMVNIALGSAPVSNCPAGDPSGNGEITIEELIVAVNNALDGC